MSRRLRHFGALVAGVIAAAAVACSLTGEPAGPAGEGAPPASPPQTATAALTPAETPERTAARAPTTATGYDSTGNMYLLYSGRDHIPDDTHQAISLAVANNDKSMVPLLIEMFRFFGNRELVIETNKALAALTGQEFGQDLDAWNKWMEWLGRNADEYRPPAGYVQWKSAFMSLIDARFGEFLAPAAQGSRIDVVELAWGGVRPDGIPDLQNPPVVPAGAQDYLRPSDRVFGVSINGEHRAYPLRIVNAHEMVNDVVGGEPIALAY